MADITLRRSNLYRERSTCPGLRYLYQDPGSWKYTELLGRALMHMCETFSARLSVAPLLNPFSGPGPTHTRTLVDLTTVHIVSSFIPQHSQALDA